MVNFQIYLPLKESLVATFNKACARSSNKQVDEQTRNVPVYQKHINFLVTLHRFRFRRKVSKMLNFQFFLPSKQPLVATLSKTRPLISRRYVAEQGMNINLKLI